MPKNLAYYIKKNNLAKVRKIITTEGIACLLPLSPHQNSHALHIAAMLGQDEIIQFLVAALCRETKLSPAEVLNACLNGSRRSPLHIAALHGNGSTVSLLVQYGMDMYARDLYGNMAFHLAIRGREKPDAVNALIDKQVNFSERDGEGMLMHEAYFQVEMDFYPPIYRFVNYHSSYLALLQKALKNAIYENSLQDIERMINQNQSWLVLPLTDHIMPGGSDNDTLLDYTVAYGSLEALIFLVKKTISYQNKNLQAVLNTRNKNQETLLFVAVRHLRLNIIAWLIKSGIDINAKNSHDQSAIHLLPVSLYDENSDSFSSLKEAVQLFFTYQTDCEKFDENAAIYHRFFYHEIHKLVLSIMCYAVRDVAALLKKNPNLLWIRFENGNTVLHCAASCGHVDMLSGLLSMAAAQKSISMTEMIKQSEERDKKIGQDSVFQAACLAGDVPMMRFLLANGADINYQSRYGTALHLLMNVNRYCLIPNINTSILFLVSNGADLLIKSKENQLIPSEISVLYGGNFFEEIKFFLFTAMKLEDIAEIERIMDVNFRLLFIPISAAGNFLHVASQQNKTSVLKAVANKLAKINGSASLLHIKDHHDLTVLNYLAFHEEKELYHQFSLLANAAQITEDDYIQHSNKVVLIYKEHADIPKRECDDLFSDQVIKGYMFLHGCSKICANREKAITAFLNVPHDDYFQRTIALFELMNLYIGQAELKKCHAVMSELLFTSAKVLYITADMLIKAPSKQITNHYNFILSIRRDARQLFHLLPLTINLENEKLNDQTKKSNYYRELYLFHHNKTYDFQKERRDELPHAAPDFSPK